MEESTNESAKSNSFFYYLAWLPIPIFLIIILILAWFRFGVVLNPPLLFAALNIIFLSIIMFFVSLLAIRSYLAKRSVIILLLGSGTLALGLGGLIAGVAILGNTPNPTVSIYNTSACIAGFFILVSAILSITMRTKILKSIWPLLASYLAVIALISVVAFLVGNHLWPVYFIQGSGPTAIDLAVLYATIILFSVSALLLLIHSVKDKLNFRIWYGLGLGLIAVGLFGVSLQTDIGDPLNWMGRVSQYLGAVYILIAIISSIRETGTWLLPWQQSLYEMEEKYHNLYTSMNEGVALHKVLYDQAGKAVDYIIMDVNPSYEEILGLKREDVIKRKASEIYGTVNPPYLDTYSMIAETGNTKSFETYFEPMGRHFSISVFSPKQGEFATIFEDITERKLEEDALQESEQRFRTVADFTYDWEYWIDPKGVFVYVSPSCERITGHKPNEFEKNANLIFEVIHPEDQEMFKKHMHTELADEKPVKMEFRVFNKNGEERWITHICQPIYDNEGIFLGRRASNRDDTERINAEQRMEYHSLLLSKVYDAVIGSDSNFRVNYWNKGAERMYGYTEAEALGKTTQELLRPTYAPGEREKIIDELEHKGTSKTTIHTKHRNGNEIIAEVNSTRIKDDKNSTSGYAVVYRDITKRKQAEIKLKETLDNLEELVKERTKELSLANVYNRNLIETALDPLVTIGPDGKITDVNRATELVTGCSRGEIIGTDFADYFTNPSEAEEGYQQVFRDGTVRDYPLEIKHKNGGTTPVLYNASVYRDESGEVIGVFAAARDITERKKAEKELREYWESLEEQVELRTEELAKSNADLKQFAYVASHDLREPLRMITSFLQLLEQRYKDQLDEDANEFISFAVDGAKRLDNMIMDLLEYSRVANKEMLYTDLDMQEIIEQVIGNLNLLIDENSAQITYDSLPTIRADENQMLRLFQNLIENAIKYRQEETPQIYISADKQDGNLLFSVKDNGIGIDAKHLERIFTIFKRLHTHEEYEGTGIGLAIAQRIVHQHGGEIWAESQIGNGTTFYFTIPT
jgi:two-component system, chemotaxis family, sensor kinase Cph1